MKRLLPLLCAAALCGCASHPDRMRPVKASFANPSFTALVPGEKPFTESALTGDDRILFLQEHGRALQLLGDVRASASNYLAAADCYDEKDEEPVVSISESLGDAAALAANDLALPYEGNAHERVMVQQLDAFNRLAMLDWDGVGVDVRRIVRLSEKERERAEARAAVAREEGEKDPNYSFAQLSSDPTYKANFAAAADVAKAYKDALQNGYAYYFAGFYYEMAGNLTAAATGYRRATEVAPLNGFAEADLRRVQNAIQNGTDPGPAPDETDVVVFFEEGFAPELASFDLRFVIGPVSVAFTQPYYPEADLAVPAAPLFIREGPDRLLAQTQVVGDFRALAARAFEDRMPYVLTRSVIRAVLKTTAAAAANNAARQHGGKGAQILVWLGGILFTQATEQADLRSWLLAPRYGHIARFRCKAGPHDFELLHGGVSRFAQIDAPPGGTVLLHVMSVPGRLAFEATGLDFIGQGCRFFLNIRRSRIVRQYSSHLNSRSRP